MIGETVTRLRPGPPAGSDRYGNPVPGVDVATPIDGCAVAPAGSSEPVAAGRSPVITRDTVYMPPGVDVTADDRLVVRGVTRTVEGDPERWIHPRTGREAGVVVRLQNVEG